jgi:CRISPR/Cas system-associated exonuclease Cas4 (RecB family)
VFLQEVFGQRDNIGYALPQGWYVHEVLLEAVIEVRPESPLGDSPFQILVGGGDNAHVHRDLFRATQPVVRRAVEHSQQLDLQARLELGHFIQEQRAGVRQFEESRPGRVRSTEGASLVPEHLTFH